MCLASGWSQRGESTRQEDIVVEAGKTERKSRTGSIFSQKALKKKILLNVRQKRDCLQVERKHGSRS